MLLFSCSGVDYRLATSHTDVFNFLIFSLVIYREAEQLFKKLN
jgi:hypothetical protein